MDYFRLNKIRKRFSPFLVLSLIFTFLYLGYIIYYLTLYDKKDGLIIYIITTILSMGGIFGVVFISILINDFYYLKVFPIIRKEFLSQFLLDNFALSFQISSKDDKKLIYSTNLINKHHNIKIINKLVNKNYYLYELSMLSDMRFRGYLYIAKDSNNYQGSNLVLTNYKYYYKHKPKKYQRYHIKDKKVAAKFKLFQSAPYITNTDKLNEILPLVRHYRSIGISNVDGIRAILFSYQIKDGQLLFLPGIFEKITPEYDIKIERELKNILKIASIDLNFN